jgi:ADP-ribose pyrophosphatase
MQLKLLKRNRLYEGKVFNIIVDDVEYPSGRKSVREVAEHPGGAVALALFPDEKIILVRQHRYPFDEFVFELPAGKLDKGEDPLHCAQRELEEETGYHASEWRKLTAIYTTPGFCNEILHIFQATNLTQSPGGRKLEEGEETMTVEAVPLAEAVAMIEKQEIVDGKTICGILLGERLLRKG